MNEYIRYVVYEHNMSPQKEYYMKWNPFQQIYKDIDEWWVPLLHDSDEAFREIITEKRYFEYYFHKGIVICD